jgi:hypothetical protein
LRFAQVSAPSQNFGLVWLGLGMESVHNGMAIDTCVENFSGAVLKALAVSTPMCRPRDDPRPPIPASIQDDIRLTNRLPRRWQITRDPTLKAEVNRLQRSITRRLNEWRNDQWSATLENPRC